MWKRLIIAVGALLLVTGCAQSPESEAEAQTNAEFVDESHPDDPFEGFNRAMWAVNYDYLDPYVARPVSLAYVNYVPNWTRTGIANFLSNLEEPASMVNSLIMLDGEAALTHFNRFFINTIFGLGGIIDLASNANVPKISDRQFGDAMGYYDIGQGPYFMMPVYGPVTLREGAGDVVDGLYPPLVWLTFPQSVLKWLFEGMESRAELVQQEGLLNNSPDPYAFTRDAYLQNKAFKARGGEVEIYSEPDDEYLDDALLDEIDNY
ncbi:MlaA family lipoprotein [Enterovibrio paralichthyis]|uniref:MlaA family lipoprotein n=1 Tax=Enterovibrio paralichthyis TaxID=2853805 RepID=UPI001C439B79|nr:MlaA family lipoprotein [Enterovibrio paralichthyis]MBV7298584.1 VacJ family lipoprotein [Enterovibrio paralichthyis]